MTKSKVIAMLCIACVSIILLSCNRNGQTPSAPVRVHVNDFTITQEDISSRKAPAAEQTPSGYSGVKALTLAFYNSSTEIYKITQIRAALEEGVTFGEFALSLPMGSYTMVIIGHGLNEGEPAVTLTGPTLATFGDNPVRETFATTQTVNITSTSPIEINATLTRIVSKLQVQSSDTRTNPAHSVRMTFAAGGKSFNPTTGFATDNAGFSNAVTISSAVGATSLSNSYLFLSADEQTMDVTIETLDESGNVVFSKTIQNVPFKRNRLTKLTGAMYTNNSVSSAIQLETTWLSDYVQDF